MGRHNLKFAYEVNGRVVPKSEGQAVVIELSSRMNARLLQSRLGRLEVRHRHAPERLSVHKAMLAVEEKIVSALWTIARQPLGRIAPLASGRCGIDYVHDRTDLHSIYTDAAGGKWDTAPPRPSLPSAKDITQADRVQDWLLLITDERLRKLLVMGATSKRGDAGRRIPWPRLRPAMPEYGDTTVRTLQRRYEEGLRTIVTELTIASLSSLSHT